MRNETESFLQQQCRMWLNAHTGMIKHEPNRWQFFSVPNELLMGVRSALIELKLPEKLINQAIALALRKAKNTGFTPGVSDAIVMAPNGVTLYVEFKTSIGRQSDEQVEFQRRCVMLGHRYHLIRSLAEFKYMITNTQARCV